MHPTYATSLVSAHTDDSCLTTLVNGFLYNINLSHCLKWICNHHSRSNRGLIILSRRSSRCTEIYSGYHAWIPCNNWKCINGVQDVEGQEHTEGFWRELFLLKPDLVRLKQILEDIDAEYLLHAPVCISDGMLSCQSILTWTQHQPRQLLLKALSVIKEGTAPLDDNALDVR